MHRHAERAAARGGVERRTDRTRPRARDRGARRRADDAIARLVRYLHQETRRYRCAVRSTDRRLLAGLGYCVVAVLCVIFSFRYFIFSGFDRLAGDDGDAKLIMAQLEHWRGVLTGRVWYDSPIWFYPVKHILGIQDGLLLNGLTHAAARLFLDEHASLETGAMLTSLIGFCRMALLFRKGIRLFNGAKILLLV